MQGGADVNPHGQEFYVRIRLQSTNHISYINTTGYTVYLTSTHLSWPANVTRKALGRPVRLHSSPRTSASVINDPPHHQSTPTDIRTWRDVQIVGGIPLAFLWRWQPWPRPWHVRRRKSTTRQRSTAFFPFTPSTLRPFFFSLRSESGQSPLTLPGC